MLYFKNPYNEFFSNVVSYAKGVLLNGSEGSIEYEALCEGVKALLETKRG